MTMINREQTIRDLENLGAWHTHHYAPFHYEAAETIHNAVVLLKEQELANRKSFYGVKPTFKAGAYYCGYCENILANYYKSCPWCGREIGWDA